MYVRDAMISQVLSVGVGDSAWTAGEILTSAGVSGVPVVDAGEMVQGVITEQDLMLAMRRGQDLRALRVGQLMSNYPVFVSPDTDLDVAADLLNEWQVRRLPVCDQGRLVGLIARPDVLRSLMRDAAAQAPKPSLPTPAQTASRSGIRRELARVRAGGAPPAEQRACPACGGPPNHAGTCVEVDGAVLPAYAALAAEWEAEGRPTLSAGELADLEELLDEWDEEPAPRS